MQRIKLMIGAIVAIGAVACDGSDSNRSSGVADLAPQAIADTAGDGALSNQAPTIRSLRLEPNLPISGDRVHAVVATEDAEGDPLTLGFVWQIDGQSIDTGKSFIELSDVSKGDRIQVALTASDGHSASEVARAEARVGNQPPVMLGVGLRPEKEVPPGGLVTATAQARDPDGDPIDYTYRWRVNGDPISEREPTLDTADLDRGDEIQAIVFASDGDEESDSIESVVVHMGNANPKILSNPDGTWSNGVFTYEIEANDPDGSGTLRYELRAGPEGMTIDPVLGLVSWAPTEAQAGMHPIQVGVSDREGATTLQSFELNVQLDTPPASTPN
jgi:hypothetical protein